MISRRSLKIYAAAIAAGAGLLPVAAHAVPITRSATVVNHSFEVGSSVGDGGLDFRPVIGWSSFSGGYINPSETQFRGGASDGTFAVFAGSLSQTLTETLVAGRTYTLSIDVGDRLDAPAPGYGIQFLAGGNLLGTVGQFDSPLPGNGWTTKSITFTALANSAGLGGALGIRLSTASGFAYYDNVRVTVTEDIEEPSEVPEPAALGLFGLGLLGLAARRRKKG